MPKTYHFCNFKWFVLACLCLGILTASFSVQGFFAPFGDNRINSWDTVNLTLESDDSQSSSNPSIYAIDAAVDAPADAAVDATFRTRWNTSLISSGSSGPNQIHLPLVNTGVYNFTVFWGDGSNDHITQWDQAETTHTYSSEGIYTVNITGLIEGWSFANSGDKLKLIEISQWGSLIWGNSGYYFMGCANLELTATDVPNLSKTKYMWSAFEDCTKLGTEGNMNQWNMSAVTDLFSMFKNATNFNQPIGDWDVSNVISMNSMFYRAESFNQPLANWNTSNLLDINYMFCRAKQFNQPIGNWNTTNLRTMQATFMLTESFNQPLNDWDVSKVQLMGSLFCNATKFNQPLNKWNTKNAEILRYAFANATSFQQDISSWDISSAYSLVGMFQGISMDTEIYDKLLNNWAKLPVKTGNGFDAGYSQYSQNGNASRTYLVEEKFWEISDGGMIWIIRAPQNINFDAGNKYVALVWDKPSDLPEEIINGYHIFRAGKSEGPFAYLATTPLPSFIDNQVVNGQTYYYRIQIETIHGNSPYSEIIAATPNSINFDDSNSTITVDDSSSTDNSDDSNNSSRRIPGFPTIFIFMFSLAALEFLKKRYH